MVPYCQGYKTTGHADIFSTEDLVMLKMSTTSVDVFAILYILPLRYEIYSYKKGYSKNLLNYISGSPVTCVYHDT